MSHRCWWRPRCQECQATFAMIGELSSQKKTWFCSLFVSHFYLIPSPSYFSLLLLFFTFSYSFSAVAFLKKITFSLKGLFTNFFLSFKSHFLDSNGVWHSWFWPEGSINAQNSKILVLILSPGTLTRGATWDLGSRHHFYPKYEIWTRGKNLVNNPFNICSSQRGEAWPWLSWLFLQAGSVSGRDCWLLLLPVLRWCQVQKIPFKLAWGWSD